MLALLTIVFACPLTRLFREQKVEVTIYTYRNGVVRVEDAEANLYAAIDLVGCTLQSIALHLRYTA